MTDKDAKINAIIDKEEEAYKAAVLNALKAMNKLASHANIRAYHTAQKALKEYLAKQTGEQERFRNIERASSWIIGQGYLVSPRTVRNHAEKVTGFPRKQKDGSYLKNEIEAYAIATWENPGRPVTESQPASSTGRDDLLAEQVRKLRLANEITEGNYILRSLVEQEFSARASFLKRDMLNLGPRFVDRMVDKLATLLKELGLETDGVNIHALVPDMETYWDRKITEHLHEYSQARGFIPEPVKGADE